MRPNIVEAHYDQLETIGGSFSNQVENISALYMRLSYAFQALHKDGWEGKAASSFVAEVEQDIFPALMRLMQGLEQAHLVIGEIQQILRIAEQEAADLFTKGTDLLIGNFASTAIGGAASDLLGQTPPIPQSKPTYTLASGVKLAKNVKEKVDQLAKIYYEKTGKRLTITSGTRDARSQARGMYTKLASGDNILRLYTNQAAAKEINDVYKQGVNQGKTQNQIVDDIERTIHTQMKTGVYISKHLKAGAVDIRSRGLSRSEKQALVEAANATGIKILEEKKPPHFHLQI